MIVGPSLAPTAVADDRPPLRQEWIGVEVPVVGANLGREDGPPDRSPARISEVIGIGVRFGRHRWQRIYVTPVEASFRGSHDDIRGGFLEAEVGWIVPVGDGAFELGLGAGWGSFQAAIGDGCDVTCEVGGQGWMVSPVVRYVVSDRTRYPWGIVARGSIPEHDPRGYRGYGVGIDLGLEIAVGH